MLCNGQGLDFRSVIQIRKGRNSGETDSRPNATEPNVRVSLFQGIPKSSKMELIIQNVLNWITIDSNTNTKMRKN